MHGSLLMAVNGLCENHRIVTRFSSESASLRRGWATMHRRFETMRPRDVRHCGTSIHQVSCTIGFGIPQNVLGIADIAEGLGARQRRTFPMLLSAVVCGRGSG